jgi:hypothetical protein
MKHFKTYLIFFIGLLVINGCDKPAITELTQDDQQQLQVEVLAKDTNDEYYTADSSGVIDDLSGYANVVTVSGIKITKGSTTINTAFAQTIFFDKSRPVRRKNGRLLGYYTRLLGNAQFNGVEAKSVPYIIRYNDGGTLQVLTLGVRHVLNSAFPNQDFGYHYSSSVAFSFDFLQGLGGNRFNFNIPTPPEITGAVRLEGKRSNNTLRARLNWDGKNYPAFQIIIAASVSGSGKIFPLFRLRTKDDGELIIPTELINQIPPWFDEFMFYFVRRAEFHSERSNNDFYVLSQSIHRIDINIP